MDRKIETKSTFSNQVEKHSEFLSIYEAYTVEVLHPYMSEVKSFFNQWLSSDRWVKYSGNGQPIPNPISKIQFRLKRPESIIDKIIRKGNVFSEGFKLESIKKMHDVVGVRIITHFLSGLSFVNKEIFDHPDLEIVTEFPPIIYMNKTEADHLSLGSSVHYQPKDNGYQSIHYKLKLKNNSIAKENLPFFEVQLRTEAQNFWAETEHYLAYKPNHKTSLAIKRHFRLISDQLMLIDKYLNLLNEDLLKYQVEVDYSDLDLLTVETFPKVLNECGLICSQKEINGLLKLLYSRSIMKVKDFRGLATLENLQLIRNIYQRGW